MIMVLLSLVMAVNVPAYADDIAISARAYVLYCVNSGEVMLGENTDERLPMASTTKVMTALITLEEAARDNRTITFTEDMQAEGSSMYLKVGEKLTLYDLAVGMLMQSGNDAANAAAISISGSVERFSEKMNARAKEIGMKDTSFVTPSGLDDDGHYSTAFDMALLLDEAMKNDDFREITSKTSMTVDFIEPSDKTVTYPNHNKLLRLYDGCIGGKTGYTERAGRCLVSCAERDGLTLIAVTLNDGDDWNDHMELFDYGFDNYAVFQPEKTEFTVNVAGGSADRIKVIAGDNGRVVVKKEDSDKISSKVFLPPFLYAPLKTSDSVGKLIYYLNGERFAETLLYPSANIR